jgi:major membrane immunogen (membrane-anchored lipoprotein)
MKKYLIIIIIGLSVLLSSCTIKNMDEKYDDASYITSNYYQTVYVGTIETRNKVSFQKFSGNDLIDTIYSGNSVTITIDREITEGRFKIVMVKSNDEITELKNGTFDYYANEGTVRIIAIGDQAKGWYKIIIE